MTEIARNAIARQLTSLSIQAIDEFAVIEELQELLQIAFELEEENPDRISLLLRIYLKHQSLFTEMRQTLEELKALSACLSGRELR